MNMTPILRQLSTEDFKKMLAVSTMREALFMRIARLDPSFEYHIDLPGQDGPREPESMEKWLANEKRVPHD